MPEHTVCEPEQRHRPAVQTRPPEHVSPQPPQLVTLVCRSTHAPPHDVSAPGQLGTHAPDEHTSAARQALPQAPQFDGSVIVSVHCVAHRS
jgi:hypothetical protein